MPKIELELTIEQVDLLRDVMISHCDEGPPGEGWPSKELEELREIVWTAIDKETQEE